MKKYIIFSYNITGMGGGQQYVYNKTVYLKKQNFDTHVFSAIDAPFVIDGLSKYSDNIIKELRYPPFSFRKKHISKIIENIVIKIDIKDGDEIFIESNGGYETQWAEMLANRLHAKHIVFSIAEQQNKTYSESYLEYLFFKYQRKELYGISKSSIYLIFKDKYVINDSEKYIFQPICTNVVDESCIETDFIFPEVDYNIGGIWRTNKEGFLNTIKELIVFFNKHKEDKFNLIIIGSGSKENELYAQQLLSSVDNVDPYFIGYMYPIPIGLLKQIDVYVSTAGSSRIPAKYDIPSITVTSAIDSSGKEKLYPLGILNYTTLNTVVPEESGYTLPQLLDLVLYERYCSCHKRIDISQNDIDDDNEFSKEMSFFSNGNIETYEIKNIKLESRNEKIFKVIAHLLGHKTLFIINNFVSKRKH